MSVTSAAAAAIAVLSGLLVVGAASSDPPSRAGRTIAVGPGADLQAALDSARSGDSIALSPGATYTGNFVLPVFEGTSYITLSTAGDDSLPGFDARVSPADAPRLAKLRSGNAQPVLKTAPGAHHWHLQLLELMPTANPSGDILQLGDGSRAQRDLASVPHDLFVDRCYIHGDADKGQKRGIALNSANTAIRGSYISDMKVAGQDSQAIAGWNGPGPFTIENNFLEAAGENVGFGGTDPAVPELVPSDIIIRHNVMSKPLHWRNEPWQVKTLFELKNARRVLVEFNLIENVWKEAQVGFAVVLTPRNQDGNCSWCTVEDVTFRSNLIRHAGGAFNILGTDNVHPSGPARRITIDNNLVYDIDRAAWGGFGAFLVLGDGPSDLSITHNTILQGESLILASGGTREAPVPAPGLVFHDNIAIQNGYGVLGADRAPGLDTLNTFFPGASFASNVIGGGDARQYPGGNQFPAKPEFLRQFRDASNDDYRLVTSSPWRHEAIDGSALGADVEAIYRALGFRFRPTASR